MCVVGAKKRAGVGVAEENKTDGKKEVAKKPNSGSWLLRRWRGGRIRRRWDGGAAGKIDKDSSFWSSAELDPRELGSGEGSRGLGELPCWASFSALVRVAPPSILCPMGIQDLQAFLPGGFHRQELGLPCFFRGSWRLYPVSAICAFAIFSGFQFQLFILFHLFPSIMLTSRFPAMVIPDWCLGSQRTSHSGGPQEPGLQPFVIAPTEGVLSLHRPPLAHSTTLEPLRTGPRVLQLPSCNSSVLSIQHFFSGDIAHANTTISAARSPSFSPHPPPPHHHCTSIADRPTPRPTLDCARWHEPSATGRRTDRCGEGEDWVTLFVQVAHCV